MSSISPRESVWGLTASGKYLTAPDRFPRADWRHKFLVTGLNRCMTAQFALLNPTRTGRDGINHYCHLPYTRNQRDRATGNELQLVSWIQDGNHVCCFVEFFGRICFALAISSHWYCPVDSYVDAECPRNQTWVRHSMSGLGNHILAWNMTFPVVAHFEVSIGDQFLSVEFWHVNNSGLCASHLVGFVVTVVTEEWYTDCVFENHRQRYSKSLLICCVIKKTAINFNVMI